MREVFGGGVEVDVKDGALVEAEVVDEGSAEGGLVGKGSVSFRRREAKKKVQLDLLCLRPQGPSPAPRICSWL